MNPTPQDMAGLATGAVVSSIIYLARKWRWLRKRPVLVKQIIAGGTPALLVLLTGWFSSGHVQFGMEELKAMLFAAGGSLGWYAAVLSAHAKAEEERTGVPARLSLPTDEPGA